MAKIVVAGGGIGGLAAAASLAGHGHHVVVLERSSTFTELGAGIQLAPNAIAALARLGVRDAVLAHAVHIEELRFMDGTTGQRVAGMSLTARYRRRFGNPYVVVHRTDLHKALLEACRRMNGIELRGGCAVGHYEQDAARAVAILDTGEQVAGDILIGADGIRSAVRRQLVGDGDPRVSGHSIYRSVIPMTRVPEELRSNTVTLWAGPKWHFVHYPIAGGKYLNLAATCDDAAARVIVGQPVTRSHVLAEFPRLASNARHLLELGQDWKSWVLCDRDPVDRWTDGRVALLGDAAHPMLQYAAQGACMALEDAVLLGWHLTEGTDDLAHGLQEYNAARRDRTARAQLVSREIGSQLYHPAGADAFARNGRLSALSEDSLHQHVEWLHGPTASGVGPPSSPVKAMSPKDAQPQLCE